MCTDAYPTVAAVYNMLNDVLHRMERVCVGWRISTQCVAKKGKRDNTSPGWRERERRDEVKEATTTDGKFFSTFHQPNLFFSFSTRLSPLYRHIYPIPLPLYFFCFCLFRELHVEGNNSVLSWITANLFHFPFWHLSLSRSSQRSFDVRATRLLTIENYRYIFPKRDVTCESPSG